MRQYQLDDKVVYTGEKLRGDLGGKMGVVLSPIEGNSEGYVVDFGSDVYVMSVNVMAPFQGHIRTPENKSEKKEKKDLLVEKRRGSKRAQDEDAD